MLGLAGREGTVVRNRSRFQEKAAEDVCFHHHGEKYREFIVLVPIRQVYGTSKSNEQVTATGS